MNKSADFKKNIPAFEKMLDGVKAEDISQHEYCRKYLHHILSHNKYYLSVYADVLEKLIIHSAKPKEKIVLLDFGAGNGVLGIFAKFCGFRKVMLNDIDPKFTEAAENLANKLHIQTDGFISGDINAVKTFYSLEKPDAVIGTDVIEHIYDLKHFFSILRRINPDIISVFTTASNPCNYLKVRQLKKLQLNDEYKGGTTEDFLLFGETHLAPFIKIRERIILEANGNIIPENLGMLGRLTRGMNEADIIAAVKNHKESGSMPPAPVHPTNTCNPLSGSWTERILSLNEYKIIYEESSFMMKIYNGFYDQYKKGIKGMFNFLLNQMTRILGIRIAPYIIFAGSKKILFYA